MDLADELLNDLDGDSGLEDDSEQVTFAHPAQSTSAKRAYPDGDTDDEENEKARIGELALPAGGTEPAQEMDVDDVKKMDLMDVHDVGSVAKLWSSRTLKDVMAVRIPYLMG